MPNEPDEVQKLLTVPEAAARLRLGKWSVYRLVERGDLPAVRVTTAARGPIRIPADALERFIFDEGANERRASRAAQV